MYSCSEKIQSDIQAIFHGAIRDENIPLIKTLSKSNEIDVNYNNGFPLNQAMINQSLSVIKVLLEDKNISLNNISHNALLGMFSNHKKDIIELIFSNIYFKTSCNRTIFRLLIKYHYSELAKTILLSNKNMDELDFEYFLEEAIVFSNMVVIKTIIEELNYNPTLQDTFISVANHYSKRVVKDYLWAIKGIRDNLKISNPDLFNTITIKYNEQKINNF